MNQIDPHSQFAPNGWREIAWQRKAATDVRRILRSRSSLYVQYAPAFSSSLSLSLFLPCLSRRGIEKSGGGNSDSRPAGRLAAIDRERLSGEHLAKKPSVGFSCFVFLANVCGEDGELLSTLLRPQCAMEVMTGHNCRTDVLCACRSYISWPPPSPSSFTSASSGMPNPKILVHVAKNI